VAFPENQVEGLVFEFVEALHQSGRVGVAMKRSRPSSSVRRSVRPFKFRTARRHVPFRRALRIERCAGCAEIGGTIGRECRSFAHNVGMPVSPMIGGRGRGRQSNPAGARWFAAVIDLAVVVAGPSPSECRPRGRCCDGQTNGQRPSCRRPSRSPEIPSQRDAGKHRRYLAGHAPEFGRGRHFGSNVSTWLGPPPQPEPDRPTCLSWRGRLVPRARGPPAAMAESSGIPPGPATPRDPTFRKSRRVVPSQSLRAGGLQKCSAWAPSPFHVHYRPDSHDK